MTASQVLRRYSRHLLLREVGIEGQRRLSRARVLCIGAGGLGSPVLQYLAAAGVGRIGICDDDLVDETNLQRQVLFATSDIGRKKTDAAAERLHAINPNVNVDCWPIRLKSDNARELLAPYDVIVDATDNFSSRYVLADACVLEGKPLVFGAIFQFTGQVITFRGGGRPCYRCVFPEPPERGTVPSCAEGGVLGAIAGIVGSWQAAAVIKVLLGLDHEAATDLVTFDILGNRISKIFLPADPECKLCGDHASISELSVLYDEDGDDDWLGLTVTAEKLDELLAEGQNVVLLDVRENGERDSTPSSPALHIPASELEQRLFELDTAKEYVVACRVGIVSRWAASRMRDAGFKRLRHLDGGMLAYQLLSEGVII
jgi:sulfur-carrier protein adenylyltransferase/sulfurtransferase